MHYVERNAAFVLDYLATHRMRVLDQDLNDSHPRIVVFSPGVSAFLYESWTDRRRPSPLAKSSMQCGQVLPQVDQPGCYQSRLQLLFP